MVLWSHCCFGLRNILLVTVNQHSHQSCSMVVLQYLIRLKHYIFVLFFGISYCIWTIIQGIVFEIDNPWTSPTPENGEDDNEALYTLIDWKNKPTLAIIVGIGVNFVAFPFLTIIFWGISISPSYCPRRYILDEEKNDGLDKDSCDGYKDNIVDPEMQ